MVREPAVLREPLQLPDAVQLLASLEFQLRVVVCPRLILDGDTDTLTIGAGDAGAFTMTVALSLAVPPGPLQVTL